MSEIKQDKNWHIKASDGVDITFRPVFVVNDLKPGEVKQATNKDVECKMFHIEMSAPQKESISMDVGFQELYMLIYFCANEELRQALQLRMERHITEIPYEVTFKLEKEEIKSGMAKRLIKLPVDEITMAAARSEAQMLAGKANLSKFNDWFAKRQQARKGRNKLFGVK
jgi:hypothetical protein